MQIQKGDTVTVISGTKIPLGTTGTAVWVGNGKWGPRVGFKPAGGGETLWTAPGNLSTSSPTAPAAAPASTIGRQRLELVESELVVLAARVAALEAALDALSAAPATSEALPLEQAA